MESKKKVLRHSIKSRSVMAMQVPFLTPSSVSLYLSASLTLYVCTSPGKESSVNFLHCQCRNYKLQAMLVDWGGTGVGDADYDGLDVHVPECSLCSVRSSSDACPHPIQSVVQNSTQCVVVPDLY